MEKLEKEKSSKKLKKDKNIAKSTEKSKEKAKKKAKTKEKPAGVKLRASKAARQQGCKIARLQGNTSHARCRGLCSVVRFSQRLALCYQDFLAEHAQGKSQLRR